VNIKENKGFDFRDGSGKLFRSNKKKVEILFEKLKHTSVLTASAFKKLQKQFYLSDYG